MVSKLMHRLVKHFGYKLVLHKPKIDATADLQNQFGVYLPVDTYYHCHKGYKLLLKLKQTHHLNLRINNEKLVEVNIGPYVFIITTWEEIFILYEIFVSGIYNLNIKEDFQLIDIGMNVGFTSIYFGSFDSCKKIIAFEPFKATIDAAIKNIALNPASSSKITVNHTGLGYPERNLEVEYSLQHKGSVGINGVATYTDSDTIPVKATMCIADVAEVLQSYLKQTNLKQIAKIDCEGAEYEIVERLSETGLLSNLDVLMIEWHMKGPDLIKSYLSKAGFTTFSFNEHSDTIGMLYAFKSC